MTAIRHLVESPTCGPFVWPEVVSEPWPAGKTQDSTAQVFAACRNRLLGTGTAPALSGIKKTNWKLMNTKERQGFTLIELLVVIGIIAILAGMLLPTLTRAKAKGNRIACSSNLRQLGLAQTLYFDDNHETFPAARIPKSAPGAPPGYSDDNMLWSDLASFAAAGQTELAWFNVLPPYVGAKALWQYAENPATFVNHRTVFTCPTSAGMAPERDPLKNVMFDYALNNKGNTGLPPSVGYGTNFTLNLVACPTAFVVYSEMRSHSSETPFYGPDPAKNLGISHGYTTQLSSRHDAGVNLNFADGHVGYFKYHYVCFDTGTKAADPGRADVNWTYNGQPVP